MITPAIITSHTVSTLALAGSSLPPLRWRRALLAKGGGDPPVTARGGAWTPGRGPRAGGGGTRRRRLCAGGWGAPELGVAWAAGHWPRGDVVSHALASVDGIAGPAAAADIVDGGCGWRGQQLVSGCERRREAKAGWRQHGVVLLCRIPGRDLGRAEPAA
jgi:hypothetical protein